MFGGGGGVGDPQTQELTGTLEEQLDYLRLLKQEYET
jgi:hypothetical protein